MVARGSHLGHPRHFPFAAVAMQGDDDQQATLLLKKHRVANKETPPGDLHLIGKLTCLNTQLLEPATQPGEYWLTGSEEVVGRGDDCSVIIHSPELSRRHARFSAYSDQWVVEDCGSRNGVWLNKERIAVRKTVSTGDTLRLGRVAFRFESALMTPADVATHVTPNESSTPTDATQAMLDTVVEMQNFDEPLPASDVAEVADVEAKHRKLIAQAKLFGVALDKERALDGSLQSLRAALPDIIDILVQKARDGDVEAAKACFDVIRWHDTLPDTPKDPG